MPSNQMIHAWVVVTGGSGGPPRPQPKFIAMKCISANSHDMGHYNVSRQYFRSDGESFSKLSAAILDKGPTVIIVWEQDGNILGGFASHSW
jgi:hypothetical protein